jgi:hypothetical protein
MALLLYGWTGRQALLALDVVFLKKRAHVFTCCSLVVVRCGGGLSRRCGKAACCAACARQVRLQG